MLLRTTYDVVAFTVCGLALAGHVDRARAQCQAGDFAKLLASDGAAGDQLGFASAIEGDTAVIGARYGDGNEPNTGAAYVYGFAPGPPGVWSQEAKLTASDGADDDAFGRSVAVWVGPPRRVVVGANRADALGDASGAAYVFRFDPGTPGTWVQEQKLLGSDTASGDNFGHSVDIWDDVIVIGARGDAAWTGSAYVFRFNGPDWSQEQKLVASGGASGDQFGSSVAVCGDAILVGAYSNDNENGLNAGAAYVFRFDGADWDQEAKMVASNGAADDSFGWSVGVSGDVALIGAYGDDDNGNQSGSAYVFRFDSGAPGYWVQEQHLLASDGALNDRFGYAVAVSGGLAVIGANYDKDLGVSSGSAYVFGYSPGPPGTWIEQAKLLASDGAANDQFAYSVAISAEPVLGDRRIVGGAFNDDDNGNDSGSAYVFHGLADCNQNDTLDLCDLAEGTSHDHDGNGIPDECEGEGEGEAEGEGEGESEGQGEGEDGGEGEGEPEPDNDDAAAPDAGADGLSDEEEPEPGTDPLDPDTEGDGVGDSENTGPTVSTPGGEDTGGGSDGSSGGLCGVGTLGVVLLSLAGFGAVWGRSRWRVSDAAGR